MPVRKRGSNGRRKQQSLAVHRLHEKGRAERGAGAAHPSFWVAAYPPAGLAFQRILATAGALAAGDCRLRNLRAHFWPFGRDVLSMHRPQAMREMLVDNNPAILHETAMVRRVSRRQRGSHVVHVCAGRDVVPSASAAACAPADAQKRLLCHNGRLVSGGQS